MQNSFIMNSNVCDEKSRLLRFGSWPGTGRPKCCTEKCLFHEKKCVDHMTLAVCTTGRPYRTSAHILPENNF